MSDIILNVMNTVHLIYSTLKRILDLQTNGQRAIRAPPSAEAGLGNGFNSTDKHTIRLIKRINKIKSILSEYCALPRVIDDIIYEYNNEIIEYDVDKFSCDHGINYFNLDFIFHNIDFNIEIHLVHFTESNHTLYYLFVTATSSNIVKVVGKYFNIIYIGLLNRFMKKVYNKKHYISCITRNYDVRYIMKKNTIMRTDHENNDRVYIKNYRKFTYLIVELKCIVNGIQRYFKTTNINKHCVRKN